MSAPYDLAVIGSGTAALVAAQRVRKAGWRVAIIDFRPYGGTCALRGCDPKKMLRAGADLLDHVRRMQGKGVEGEVRIDWRDLVAFKNTFTGPIPGKHEKRHAENGIETFHGPARFTGPNTLDVGGEAVEARNILIAAGAEPTSLGIPGQEHVLTNEHFYDLGELPRRIVLIGGGYIAAEYAHLAARAGAQVTILQRGPRLLPQFDPDLVGWLMERFADIGVDVRLRTEALAVEKAAEGFTVHARSGDQPVALKADMVAHAAGRRPALQELDLDAAGIAHQEGRLLLHAHLQSVSNPAVHAAGDAALMGPPLTPVSSHDAKVVARNLLEGAQHTPNYLGVPCLGSDVRQHCRGGHIPIRRIEGALNSREEVQGGFRIPSPHGDDGSGGRVRVVHKALAIEEAEVERLTGRIADVLPVRPHLVLDRIGHGWGEAWTQPPHDQPDREFTPERFA